MRYSWDNQDKIYFMMFRRVSDPTILNQLNEPEVIVKQRKALTETMGILKQAKKLLVKDSQWVNQFAVEP